MDKLLEPEDRVLSTLNADGTRRWLKPRVFTGRFWHMRRAVAYLLIIIFTAIPYINIYGKPAILLDIINRRFTFFGKTLFATDTLLLALFLMIVFVTIFMLTAIFGRVWCGWACPQTVYMEFVYRPIERLFEGKPGKRTKKIPGWRRAMKFFVYFLVSAFLAHTFLNYFVGAENLRQWILGSPLDHPIAFTVMVFITGMMLFDFGFFREQTCIVACPYGRMQSAMLDRASLIVAYDEKRGEPRGKIKVAKHKNNNGDVSLEVVGDKQGDCIDCTMCVQTCPTGIDIRDGLQMECIHCTQCIDACDQIMDKIGKPRGLIRYSSQEALETGKSHFLRPRMIIYPLLLAALLTAFVIVLSTKSHAEVVLIRTRGTTFSTLPDGRIINNARLRITNRTDAPVSYTATVISPDGVMVKLDPEGKLIAPEQTESVQVHFMAPPEMFTTTPQPVLIQITGSDEFEKELKFSMHGPYWKGEKP